MLFSGDLLKKNIKILKSIAVSLAAALLALLLFAALSALFNVDQTLLRVFALLVRLFSSAAFCFVFAHSNKILLRGIVSGVLSYLCVFFVFLIFSGGKTGGNFLSDLLFTVIFAIIFSIIFANLKKKGNNS